MSEAELDGDRKPRFSSTDSSREQARAASQPPRSAGFSSSPNMAYRDPQPPPSPVIVGAAAPSKPWTQTRYPPINRALTTSAAVPPPTRSASFSAMSERTPPGSFTSSVRAERIFPSTFEDDEEDYVGEHEYDADRYIRSVRQAQNGHDSRSRSQSVAAPGRQGLTLNMTGLPAPTSSLAHNWSGHPSSLYGEIRPPSRYTPVATSPHPSSAIPISRGYPSPSVDASNMSPFVRDVNRAILDDTGALRDLWGRAGGGGAYRDESGPPSGTASRRHSVSIVQPLRLTATDLDAEDVLGQYDGPRALMISDEELAGGLGAMLNLEDGPRAVRDAGPPSQPASLPIYRGPGALDPGPPRYVPMNLSGRVAYAPSGRGLFADDERSPAGSPARAGERFAAEVGSPPRHAPPFRAPAGDFAEAGPHGAFARDAGAAYLPPNGGARFAPPTFEPYHGPAAHAHAHPHTHAHAPHGSVGGGADEPALAELGKGVPLHAVPAACPLFIVEFKAGRTDLFYATDRAPGLRVGDIVIVEADRGRDLGTVVNDSITAAEVEAFQAQRALDAPPLSPGGGGGPKKDIHPKRIYGKAQPQDIQSLETKRQEEQKALALCQTKVKQKKLPMEVVDAEYQWDRRKLTFYFISDKRIDFRELVRELFRLYKTRIWMASLQGPTAD